MVIEYSLQFLSSLTVCFESLQTMQGSRIKKKISSRLYSRSRKKVWLPLHQNSSSAALINANYTKRAYVCCAFCCSVCSANIYCFGGLGLNLACCYIRVSKNLLGLGGGKHKWNDPWFPLFSKEEQNPTDWSIKTEKGEANYQLLIMEKMTNWSTVSLWCRYYITNNPKLHSPNFCFCVSCSWLEGDRNCYSSYLGGYEPGVDFWLLDLFKCIFMQPPSETAYLNEDPDQRCWSCTV